MKRASKVASTVSSFVRDRTTGRVVLVQPPNLPLWIFLVAAGARRVLHPAGAVGVALAVVGGVGLAWWAVLEIVSGDSPFRRVLGAAVFAAQVGGLLLR